jgi:histidine triad (HIT) family protein
MKKRSILFVCTGNVFRSKSANLAFNQYLKDNNIKNWKVDSAGTIANREESSFKTIDTLHKFGIKNTKHKQKKLTKKMLDEYDIIVAMADYHQNFIKKEFNYNQVILFNELALHKNTSVWDINDVVKNRTNNEKAVQKHIEKTIKYIVEQIPNIYKNACERFYLFDEFVNGCKKHSNGYPFIKLHETKNTLSFMSIDIPSKKNGHILIIPKKRFSDFAHVPKQISNELIHSIQKIAKAISKNHGGYNVLLNNGLDAGQYIYHTHFHIIPRNYNDGIKIEGWNHETISEKEFIKLNKLLLKQINSV